MLSLRLSVRQPGRVPFQSPRIYLTLFSRPRRWRDRALKDFNFYLDGGPGIDLAGITQNVKEKGSILKFEKGAIVADIP